MFTANSFIAEWDSPIVVALHHNAIRIESLSLCISFLSLSFSPAWLCLSLSSLSLSLPDSGLSLSLSSLSFPVCLCSSAYLSLFPSVCLSVSVSFILSLSLNFFFPPLSVSFFHSLSLSLPVSLSFFLSFCSVFLFTHLQSTNSRVGDGHYCCCLHRNAIGARVQTQYTFTPVKVAVFMSQPLM